MYAIRSYYGQNSDYKLFKWNPEDLQVDNEAFMNLDYIVHLAGVITSYSIHYTKLYDVNLQLSTVFRLRAEIPVQQIRTFLIICITHQKEILKMLTE